VDTLSEEVSDEVSQTMRGRLASTAVVEGFGELVCERALVVDLPFRVDEQLVRARFARVRLPAISQKMEKLILKN
jgi:hypothetical protein